MSNGSSAPNLSTAWEKYLSFERLARQKDVDINSFIAEWEEKRDEAKSAGCNYSDFVLALKLMEKVNLGIDTSQSIISKVESEGHQGSFLHAIIDEIRNMRKSPISQEVPLVPNTDGKPDQELKASGTVAKNISSLEDFSEFAEAIDAVKSKAGDRSNKKYLFTKKSLGKYGCNQCFQVFRSKFQCQQHLKMHSNRYQCSKCKRGFLTKNMLEVHLKRCQPGIEFDEETDFSDMALLVKTDGGEPSENKVGIKEEQMISPCEICGLLLRESKMKNHLVAHKPRLKCATCNKLFPTNSALKSHEMSHLVQRNFICTTCGKSFKTKFVLTMHTNTHNRTKSNTCPWCRNKFYDTLSYDMHLRFQHRGEGIHRCDVCQERFFTKSKLRFHMRTHAGERHYKCEYCDKAYDHKQACDKHVRRSHIIELLGKYVKGGSLALK